MLQLIATSLWGRLRTAMLVFSVFALILTGVGAAQAAQPGGIGVFATVPADPGFPEGIAVHGNWVFVSGPARFGTAGTGPSAIHVYNRKTGSLIQTIVVQGEALEFEHAVSNIAVDGAGRLYALSTQLGLIRFTKQGQTYVQTSYGDPVPDLPICAAVTPGVPCSPTTTDAPPIVNDIVFDAQGYAYVTDSLQATIFRYAPGGGPAEIWLQSADFEGGGPIPFGLNGMRVNPERTHLYFVVSTTLANPVQGIIYRLPIVDNPTPADLEVFYTYSNAISGPFGEIPDQLAFGAKGDLYVSLAFTNQISVISPNGVETKRIASAPTDSIPLDSPAGIAFDARTKSLLIANHALLSANPANFAVLKVFVNDPGNELVKP
jgi:sugar lactone lactonase YvrE